MDFISFQWGENRVALCTITTDEKSPNWMIPWLRSNGHYKESMRVHLSKPLPKKSERSFTLHLMESLGFFRVRFDGRSGEDAAVLPGHPLGKSIMIGWLTALLILLAIDVSAGAAENGQSADKPKDPAAAVEPKKQEADTKRIGCQAAADEKGLKERRREEEKTTKRTKRPKTTSSKDDKAAKTEEVPPRGVSQQEEPKKSIFSPNLTIKLP